jgi:DNA-binding IclR family transcriptional regulator
MEAQGSALGKGLRVLEALAASGRPRRLSELAVELGMHKTSVHRILWTLIGAGLVRQDPGSGLYVPTLKLWELGTAVVNEMPVKQAATPVLLELQRRTGETVSLTVLDGDDVVYLDKIIAPRPAGFTTRVGSRVPAPRTVAGRAMLAYEENPRELVERVAARWGGGAEDVERVLADIARAQRDGYLVGTGRPERGITGIAAAVPGPRGRAAAGLTVSALTSRTSAARQGEIVDALLRAVAALGDAVGRS